MSKENTLTWNGKKRMEDIKREWNEYCKQFEPKKIGQYEENGLVINVYEGR